MESLGIHEGVDGRVSDHSIISCEIIMRPMEGFDSTPAHSEHTTPIPEHLNSPQPEVMPSRYKIKRVPDNFLSNSENAQKCIQWIDEIMNIRASQKETDKVHTKLLSIITDEMSLFLKKLSNTPCSKKAYRRVAKEWWDKEVESAWKNMRNAEREHLKIPNHDKRHKALYKTFVQKQHTFDKMSRAKKRRTQRNKVNDIEKANVSDPKAFWNYIKNLTPRNKKEIPWEILDNNGNVITDKGQVIKHWSNEFNKLLTPPPPTPQMQQKIQNIASSNRQREQDPNFDQESTYNRPFDLKEVERLVKSAKSNKAPGYDTVVYDVLKNDTAIKTLVALFNHCFTTGCIPELWKKGVISPLPKGKSSNPRDPTSYRGISLLSCIGKLYTAGLSQRLSKHLESNGYLVNEQNGFRPERLCIDHVFVLYDCAKIRLNHYQDTYMTFVDFSKAFDFIQREFLFHKLLDMNVKGKLYTTIKSIYTKPESYVALNNQR